MSKIFKRLHWLEKKILYFIQDTKYTLNFDTFFFILKTLDKKKIW